MTPLSGLPRCLGRLLARPLDDFEQLEQLRPGDIEARGPAPSWFDRMVEWFDAQAMREIERGPQPSWFDRLTMRVAGWGAELVLLALLPALFVLAVLLWEQH